MNTRKHIHEETFSATPDRLFALLHSPSAIRAWWGASRAIVMPEPGGIWAAAWGDSEDDPDYITVATMAKFIPPRCIRMNEYRYRAKSGPLPFEAEMTVEFTVDAQPEGATLRVVQDGFPEESEADAFYEACEKGWADTFDGIRRYLTSTST